MTCDVETSLEASKGTFANGFRVVPDGAEFFLDFLHHQPASQETSLVARIRVPPHLLSAVRDRIANSMLEVV